jgi:hypothetical protein
LDVVGAGVAGAIAVCGGLALWLDVEGGVLMFWLVVDGVRWLHAAPATAIPMTSEVKAALRCNEFISTVLSSNASTLSPDAKKFCDATAAS